MAKILHQEGCERSEGKKGAVLNQTLGKQFATSVVDYKIENANIFTRRFWRGVREDLEKR